jgi:UDP-glucose 4-epimerase
LTGKPSDSAHGMKMTQQPLPERVLVLGGTGFLGSEITRAFLTAGSSVTVLARHQPSGWGRSQIDGAELIQGDVSDPFILSPLLDRVDHVVHAVGAMLPKESNANPAMDVTTTLPAIVSLLELLRHRPAVGLTYLSSGGTVYGNPAQVPVSEASLCHPITSYGVVKLAAEKYIGMYATLYGVPARIARVSNAYGPLQPSGRSQGIIGAFLASARDGSSVQVFGDGKIVRDYIHIDDVAHAVVQLVQRSDGPSVVNVGSGVGHTILDVLAYVGQVTGARMAVDHLPDRGFDVRQIVLDISVLSNLISWSPTPLQEGIERTWQNLLTRANFAGVG